ncbi:Cof-type HAD-IIB family hydrolase [Gemella cuniculi]|uniref:Cof-type HAD-IIB family hydrolase n=1 Tax=Gemella cuniculi TaxID=150240 RepID=UPI000421493F|nr:Cof-type HAD-IIB family hydrolase [Gemella cuniculi]
MKYLFVTDLDGTFVKDSVSVAEEDLNAYYSAKKYGDFSVATGRSVEEIKYISQGNNLDVTHMIGFNGAVVTQQNSVIFKKFIPSETLEKIFKYLKENKLIFDALDGVQRIGNFQHEKTDRLWNMKLICEENPFKLLEGKIIYKINVRPSREELNKHYEKMKELFSSVEIYKSGATRLEVTAKGTSKASGINLIKDGYDYVVTLGDSGNDVAMFKNSDISYCMQKAPKEVQDEATHVVENFAQAIEHFENKYGKLKQ